MSNPSYKTVKEWRELGRMVSKGSKPHGWAWNNYALYTIDQTEAFK